MEDKELEKNEEIVAESTEENTKVEPVVEETKEEKASENTNNDEPKKDGYHLIMENFKPAVIMACIVILAIPVVVIVLSIIANLLGGIHPSIGNVCNALVNGIGAVAEIIVGFILVKLFRTKTQPKKNEDLASFIVSLVAFILAFVIGLGWVVNTIVNLFWAIVNLF